MLKIKTFIRRFLVEKLNLHRPSSLPYLTGDTLRSVSHHILDESTSFKPKNVAPNEIVFVRTNYLEEFFEKKFPYIANPFILITHNEDLTLDKKFISYLDDKKIIHWFAENCLINHEKLTPLPIGIYNQYNDARTQILKNAQLTSTQKELKIAYGFSTNKSIERTELKELLSKLPLCQELNIADYTTYIKKVSSYSFIISPRGNGIDCHRTWESILLGVVPILISNPLTKYWQSLGLPVLLIDNWQKLHDIDEVFLKEQYDTIMKDFSLDPVFFDYWQREIFSKINTQSR